MNALKYIQQAIRNLPRKGQHNVVKILCLAMGIAMSSVIIAEIYFEQTYDTFFPYWQRTYQVNECCIHNGKYGEYPQTSGAEAHGIKEYSPQVEAATRYTSLLDDVQCEIGRKNDLHANIYLADNCLFDVLPRPILQGNAKAILSQPFYCMISRSMAEKIGKNVIGQHIKTAQLANATLIIGGVFEDFPRNSAMKGMDIICALNTIHYFGGFDGSENWIGNDRYISYIRMKKGHTTDELKPNLDKMIKERFPLKEMKEAGVKMNFSFTNISDAYTQSPYIKMMFWIMSIEAFVLLFSALMNYLLIVIGNMVGRSREMAIRKCFGAGRQDIHGIIFSEAAVQVTLAILLAAILVFSCKGEIEHNLSAPLSVLIYNKGSWIIATVCLTVLLISGIIPGILYSRIPISSAFRGYTDAKHQWKMWLLAIQFAASGLFFTLLMVINLQYNHMVNNNPGFATKNLAVMNIDGINANQRAKMIEELRKIPGVDNVSACSFLPLEIPSGNNIMMPGEIKELFNTGDGYYVYDGYLKLMGIKIIEGSNFTEHTDSSTEVLIDENFAKKLKITAHISGDIIGRRIKITEHCDSLHPFIVIHGVFKNIRIGSAAEPDQKPYMLFYANRPGDHILIRFDKLDEEGMKKARDCAEALFPDRDVKLQSYSAMDTDMYASQKSFRNGILTGGIVTFCIALFGLVGYTLDEVNRRRKEIAIRKVNGASTTDILKIFMHGIIMVAIPSLTAGCIAAYAISAKWIQSFTDRITLSPLIFISTALMILIIIVGTVAINSYKVANSNPVKYLKDE